MTLKMDVTRGGSALFTHEEDGMTVRWTISSSDDQAAILAKLKKILTFMGEDPAPVYQLPVGGMHRGSVPPRLSGQPESTGFTGIAPVQPPPLDASIQHATQNGWELIQDGNE